jgi:hypothetical protein
VVVFLLGLALLGAGFFMLWLALPREGHVRSFVGSELKEYLVSLSIILSWVAGAAIFISGLL